MPGALWRRTTIYFAWQSGQPKLSLDGDVLEEGVCQFVRRWSMVAESPYLVSSFCRCAFCPNRGIATANLCNIVPVLTIIRIRPTNTNAVQCIDNRRRLQFCIPSALLFDKGRQCVRIIGNSAPQLVIGQM